MVPDTQDDAETEAGHPGGGTSISRESFHGPPGFVGSWQAIVERGSFV
jgi:hypothetical protein